MSTLRDALRDLADDVFFDLLESEDAYLLVLDVPGVRADAIDLAVEGDTVRLEAKREKSLPGEFQYVEENRPVFLDVELPLPEDASGDGLSMDVDRGVLEIHVPKRDAADATGGGDTGADATDGDATADTDDTSAAEPRTGTDGETPPTDDAEPR
ncbi:Hsp20/alpha crystallin family protein [Halopiger goleimassiliensis]|uniref:Hsp20/alpha crystallin family protein n=1 Tax=Halopiger goleimassiliensis TaxID=1293048 RepID=UPI0009DBD513|nr:Hsp20/alpha crystallin family protein [Halopiger goleimassiliensis]